MKILVLGIVKLPFFEYDNMFITFEDACRVTIVSDMQRMADQGMSLHTEIYITKKCNLEKFRENTQIHEFQTTDFKALR